MAAQLIDGNAISALVKEDVKKEVAQLKAQGIEPGLAVVLVGENPASKVYVSNKRKACDFCGIYSVEIKKDANISQTELMGIVEDLNKDPKIHGILVQLPLPKGLDEEQVLLTINPEKDVDGFHPYNVGRFMTIKMWNDIMERKLYLPCTPYGCIELLDRAGVNLSGAKAVVVGRSNIVGKPAALLLMAKNATVTVCHSRTKDLPGVVREGDVVIAAIGQPEFVKGDWIKEGAAVIDVGINRLSDEDSAKRGRKLVGDVEFDEAAKRAAFITPVPGGVGPMTIAMLMKNTIMAAKRLNKI